MSDHPLTDREKVELERDLLLPVRAIDLDGDDTQARALRLEIRVLRECIRALLDVFGDVSDTETRWATYHGARFLVGRTDGKPTWDHVAAKKAVQAWK